MDYRKQGGLRADEVRETEEDAVKNRYTAGGCQGWFSCRLLDGLSTKNCRFDVGQEEGDRLRETPYFFIQTSRGKDCSSLKELNKQFLVWELVPHLDFIPLTLKWSTIVNNAH